MRIGLKANKEATQMAEKWLMDVSHPKSMHYGKHWSQEQVISAFAPSEDTISAVSEWLVESGGIAKERITHTNNKAWLAFDATVEEAEKLLMTEYHEIHGEEKSTMITHDCIRALYNIPSPDPEAEVSPNNTMDIFLLSSAYAQEDLDLFFSNFTPYIDNGTAPILKSINGGVAPVDVLHAGSEADMDLELAIPLVYPQEVVAYQVDDDYWAAKQVNEGGMFNTFLDAIDGSYCTYEAYGETGDNPDFDPVYPNDNEGGYKGERMCGTYKCDEWLKLGLQGVSVFIASGDNGVGDLPKPDAPNGCLRNDTVFSPAHPNTCPWLTSVGATKVYPGKTVYDPESAAYNPEYYFPYSSGGGFSNVFGIPDYQAEDIANYLANNDPGYDYYLDGNWHNGTGIYNRNGRGFPDVSANGDNTAAVFNGALRLTGGTSASTPIFASVINLINEERIKAGKGPVGFVNPVLYAHPEVLNDITNGTNPGCGTDGFAASKGWDPATGLGTPNYPKMLDLFMSLP
ncbi:hypothetical protein SLS60_009888 [Paraconiothyrium brasiliense]|uniref:Peptidase S53 domain-containing protein n=1 Tax=Paraconiothyrium brasiliense TaxID=300254 RepID=A0ABR3QSV0_9PLEO